MKVYKKEWTTFIPRPLPAVWDFFSRPENLNEVTPDEMNFEILSNIVGVPMYTGMIILYKVSPVLNIPLHWCTEITHLKNQEYFIDEQRSGPYAMWHHEHHFKAVDGGTEMRDLLHYSIPFGPLGRLANSIFVGSKVDSIFAYREEALEELVAKI